MTDEMMNLRSLVEKAPDADVLRDMIAFAAERLMELGGRRLDRRRPRREEHLLRLVQRNGYRDRDWETPGPARLSCAFPGYARAATSPVSSSRGGWPRRRSPQ